MLTEDLTVYFNTAGWGEAITVAGASVNAIVDWPTFDMDLNGNQIKSAKIYATCRTADVSTAKKGTAATIRSVSLTVQEASPDGSGVTQLVLTKA